MTTDNDEMRHFGVAHLTATIEVKFLWRRPFRRF